ncbi:MAG: hypothetical protein ACNI27_14705 [Desulfovibrio sp.]
MIKKLLINTLFIHTGFICATCFLGFCAKLSPGLYGSMTPALVGVVLFALIMDYIRYRPAARFIVGGAFIATYGYNILGNWMDVFTSAAIVPPLLWLAFYGLWFSHKTHNKNIEGSPLLYLFTFIGIMSLFSYADDTSPITLTLYALCYTPFITLPLGYLRKNMIPSAISAALISTLTILLILANLFIGYDHMNQGQAVMSIFFMSKSLLFLFGQLAISYVFVFKEKQPVITTNYTNSKYSKATSTY